MCRNFSGCRCFASSAVMPGVGEPLTVSELRCRIRSPTFTTFWNTAIELSCRVTALEVVEKIDAHQGELERIRVSVVY